jgi:hypothetical protein
MMTKKPDYSAALFANEALTVELTPLSLDGVKSDDEANQKVHDFAARWMKARGVGRVAFQIVKDAKGLGPRLVGRWYA